jgi:hypothetical protein
VAPEPGDEVVLALQAARRSPVTTATATMRNRPGLSIVTRIVLPSLRELRPLITSALGRTGGKVIVLPFAQLTR